MEASFIYLTIEKSDFPLTSLLYNEKVSFDRFNTDFISNVKNLVALTTVKVHSRGMVVVPAAEREHVQERESEKNAVLVQFSVFQESIFKGEAFFLPLTPLLEVEVDVGALKRRKCPSEKQNSNDGPTWASRADGVMAYKRRS